MAVTNVTTDLENATLTVDASFNAPIDKVWALYAGPRKLERWWGPPSHPATVTEHELTPGGRVAYYMTGPEGEQYHGLWEVTAVDEPNSFEIIDRFANADGTANTDLPAATMRLEFTESDGVTTMRGVTQYASSADLQAGIDMGMEEGMRQAMGQMDDLLAA